MPDTVTTVILSLLGIAICWQLTVGLRPMWMAGGAHSSGRPSDPADRCASLTVVLFASCNEETLHRWISEILDQDYPDYNVVVVYDSNYDATSLLAERYASEKKLYFTFVPPGSHTLNRRKLALTLGIKAATGDYVLTTVPNVDIPSRSWLSKMMEPVNSPGGHTEVVLGYSHFDLSAMRPLSRFRAGVESITQGSRWIGDALRGNPWRGDGNNLVFLRRMFFDCKGFSEGIILEGGDDDIFVGRIANGENTAVCVSPDTILTINWGTSTSRVWKMSRRRYMSTKRMMPLRPRLLRLICRWISWLSPLVAAGAVWLSGMNLWVIGAASILLLLLYIVEFIAFRRAFRRLKGISGNS